MLANRHHSTNKSLFNLLYLYALATSIIWTNHAASAAELSGLPATLQEISTAIFPDFRGISVAVFDHPEISLNETYAHGLVVDYFQNQHPDLWNVTSSVIPSHPTAWKLEFEHRPADWSDDGSGLPMIGFMAEYDALLGIGHSCGHNLILLNGLLAANLARQAVIDYNIPARIVLVGTPDEEDTAGKHALEAAGVFDGIDVWMMAHPTVSNAVQPMSARHNVVVKIVQDTHFDAVKDVYNILVAVKSLSGNLPATASTATPVEDVGMFACNIQQTNINLGVLGQSLDTVSSAISSIKAANPGYATTSFSVAEDSSLGGIAISFNGTGGHAAENTLGALDLSIDTFDKLLVADSSTKFYLPGNTSSLELDFLVDVRTRYTADIPSVDAAVLEAIPTKNVSWDLPYPALEVTPFLPEIFVNLIAQPGYGSQNWSISTTAPAATDASFVQGANIIVNGNNHTLVRTKRVVFHPNYSICTQTDPTACPFNHEPRFRDLAGADFGYEQTEKVARALAQIAVELLNDPNMMANATAIINR